MGVDYLPAFRGHTDPYIGQERAAMHTLALGIGCTYCGQGIGAPCVNPRTGAPLSWRLPAHDDRIVAATRDYEHNRTEHHA